MYEPEPTTGLEAISEAECLQLLEQHHFGRVVVVADGQPLIVLIGYRLSHGMVAFRAREGTPLSHALGSNVAFEIDGYEPSTGIGWSVVVLGTAVEDVSERMHGAPSQPATPDAKVLTLAIRSTTISGRQFTSDTPPYQEAPR